MSGIFDSYEELKTARHVLKAIGHSIPIAYHSWKLNITQIKAEITLITVSLPGHVAQYTE